LQQNTRLDEKIPKKTNPLEKKMKRILILADTKWSVGRVHQAIATALSNDFVFKLYDGDAFRIEEFLEDFHNSDLCLTALYCFKSIIKFCKLASARDQQKIVAVCHGYQETIDHSWSPHVTYGTVSDILLPFMPADTHVVPNGGDQLLFEHKPHTGKLKLLGWCGELQHAAKMSDKVFDIARLSRLPVSIAETLSLEELKTWYHSIDVLLVTSGPVPHIETGPLPPFEAILSGVVVIGTRVGNFRKAPGPKFETVEEAAEILVELKAKPEKMLLLAKEQYDWVVENWTYKTLCKSWKQMFDTAIAKTTKFLDFIEIGTSDFDTEIEKKDDKVGVSIEPIKYYLDRLPNKRNCTKLNMAISDKTGTCQVNFVADDTVQKLQLPWWVRGCSCINSYHQSVLKLCQEISIDFASIISSETIPMHTLYEVVQTLTFDGLYLLKIDTEGHDPVILKKFVQDFCGDRRLLPHVLQFESNVLSTTEAVDEIIQLFLNLGYDLTYRGTDTVMQRNLQKQPKQNFSTFIANYYIMDHPLCYDVSNLPHANTLEAAKEYCVRNNCSGVTFQDGLYQVRSGKYMHHSDLNVVSWIYA